MKMEPATEFVRSQQILWSDLEDEVVMMNIDQGSYFSLKGPSARVWQLLQDPTSLQDMQDLLTTEYDVSVHQCHAELRDLMAKLCDKKLVHIVPASANSN